MQYEERYDMNKLKFLNSLSLDTYTKLIHKESAKKTDIKSNFETFRKFVSKCITNNGEIQPVYSQNCLRGRFYARSPSIQQLSKHIRGFLCSEISTDIDIKNCYPVILKYICNKNNILCPDLTYYVEHRDEIFKEYKSECEEIKKQIFTIMFGGRFTPKNDFVIKFKKEYLTIQTKLSNIKDYKDYFDNFNKAKPNKEGGATFKIIEDVEKEVVSKAIDFLKAKKCEILAYMYDGCMIYGDYYENSDLLRELNECVLESFAYLNIEFVYKNHLIGSELIELYKDFDPDDQVVEREGGCSDAYEEERRLFEKYCAKIIDKSVFIVEKFKNNRVYETLQFTECKLMVSYRHLEYITMVDNKPKTNKFLQKWLNDSCMRLYDNVDIFPPGVLVPNNYYNLWTSFEAEYIQTYTHKQNSLDFILNHIKIICGNDEDVFNYFVKWIAYIIQCPSKKSICPVFVSKEGAGKGSMFNLFRKMLGDKKILECTVPERDVWGDFNGPMMNAYLVNINELGKKQQSDSIGKIKGLITDHELVINQKGQPQVKIMSYHKFIITTNSEDPVYTDENDRRFFVIRSSDEKLNNLEYFKKMNEYLDDPDVIKTCYEYFKNIPDIINFPFLVKPVSKFHDNLKELNKSVITQFLEHLCYLHSEKVEVEYTTQDLYKDFTLWVDNNGIKYETSSLKLMCSIRNLNHTSIVKKQNNKGRFSTLNIKQLKNDLKIVDFFENGQAVLKF